MQAGTPGTGAAAVAAAGLDCGCCSSQMVAVLQQASMQGLAQHAEGAVVGGSPISLVASSSSEGIEEAQALGRS